MTVDVQADLAARIEAVNKDLEEKRLRLKAQGFTEMEARHIALTSLVTVRLVAAELLIEEILKKLNGATT